MKFLIMVIAAFVAFLTGSSAAFLTSRGLWGDYGSLGWLWAYPDLAMQAYYEGIAGWNFKWKLALAFGAIGGAVAAYIAVTFASRIVNSSHRRFLHGYTQWQTIRGAIKSGITFHVKPPPDGVIIGKLYFGPTFEIPAINRRFGLGLYAVARGDFHLSLTAPTRTGKGVGCVIPNALNWGGSVFIFSVKDDVYKATAAQRERMGDRVFLLDLTNPDYRTHRFTGFGELSDIYDDVQRAMFTLIPKVEATNPFWNDAARMVATAVGVMFAHSPDLKATIGNILRAVRRDDFEEYLIDMIKIAEFEERPYPAAATETVLNWIRNSESTGGPAKASVQQTIVTSLSLWNIPRIVAATNADDFELSKIRSQPVAIYVVAQPGDIQRLRPIFDLLFTQLFYMNAKQEWSPQDGTHRDIRTLLIFDERWAVGGVRVVDDALAFIASYGFRMLNVLQTKDQMRRALGEEGARNMFDNSYIELIFGQCDMQTAKEVSERIGEITVTSTSKSKHSWLPFDVSRRTQSDSERGRRLMMPQEIASLPADTVIALIKGQYPLRLTKIKWFQDGHFRGMAGDPPLPPKLEVREERRANLLTKSKVAIEVEEDCEFAADGAFHVKH